MDVHEQDKAKIQTPLGVRAPNSVLEPKDIEVVVALADAAGGRKDLPRALKAQLSGNHEYIDGLTKNSLSRVNSSGLAVARTETGERLTVKYVDGKAMFHLIDSRPRRSAAPARAQPRRDDADATSGDRPARERASKFVKRVGEMLDLSYSHATLLATLNELDVIDYYENYVRSGSRLPWAPLKSRKSHDWALRKLTSETESRGYRLVVDNIRVVGYVGVGRIPRGARVDVSDRDDGTDPILDQLLTSDEPGITDAVITALRLHPSHRGANRPEMHPAKVYQYALIAAVQGILVEFARAGQWVERLWVAPSHRDEIDYFENLSRLGQPVKKEDGTRPLFVIRLLPFELSRHAFELLANEYANAPSLGVAS